MGDRFLFVSREYEPLTGLYYYRARQVEPTVGRFVSEDPSRFAAGDSNLYRYVFNGPLSATDPTGEVFTGALLSSFGSRLLGGFVGGVLGAASGNFLIVGLALGCPVKSLGAERFRSDLIVPILSASTAAGVAIGQVIGGAGGLNAAAGNAVGKLLAGAVFAGAGSFAAVVLGYVTPPSGPCEKVP